ncbi:MAG: hypothetical protein NTW21_19240 [Verrucomicrobia bacterium]|nr:hypothetical protein [Verrucomicrobiota bacterium]
MKDPDPGISYFSDSDDLVRERTIWRRKVAAWSIAVLVVLGFSAKPAYRAFREYRINRNLAAAQAAARAEDWDTARDKAYSVLIVRRNDFEAFRIWARALGKRSERRTYTAAASLFSDPRASREDRLEALQVLALQAPHALALRAYGSLPEALRGQASFRAAITPLLLRRSDIDIAENSLREVAQPRDVPMVRLELLRTLCSRPEVGRVAEAREIFASLIADQATEEALAALLLLGDVPGGLVPGDPLPNLPAWLKDQPRATTLHHLLGMRPALEAAPEAAERLYEAAIKRFLTTEPGVLGTWLVRQGQAELAARVLEEPAKTRPDAFLARLHALLRLKQDADLEAALAAAPDGVDPVEFEIAQASLAWLRNQPGAASAALTRAMNQAAFDTGANRFIQIARVAGDHAAQDSAEDAWVGALRLGWGPLPLYRDLLPVFDALASKGRSEDLLASYRSLLRFEPNNLEMLNRFHYLALIHSLLPPEQIITAQARLLASYPDKPEFNATMMLAEILGGHPADALARLPKMHDGKAVTPTLQTALEGTARVLGGETEAGTALLKDVNWLLLMRQEGIVFRDVLVKHNLSGLPMPELKSDEIEAAPDQIPAWRKAVKQFEKDRGGEILPALPTPRIPGADLPQ